MYFSLVLREQEEKHPKYFAPCSKVQLSFPRLVWPIHKNDSIVDEAIEFVKYLLLLVQF